MISMPIIVPAPAHTAANDAGGAETAECPIAPAHVCNTFSFIIPAPLGRAGELFGADAERSWAGENWNPQFLYPQPGTDIPGAVFMIQDGTHKNVWVNTEFDLAAGRMQYVAFVPDKLALVVNVRLTSISPSTTNVEVTYVRTALDRSANAEVEALGESDRANGAHWQKLIEASLRDLDHGK